MVVAAAVGGDVSVRFGAASERAPREQDEGQQCEQQCVCANNTTQSPPGIGGCRRITALLRVLYHGGELS